MGTCHFSSRKGTPLALDLRDLTVQELGTLFFVRVKRPWLQSLLGSYLWSNIDLIFSRHIGYNLVLHLRGARVGTIYN